MKTCVIFCAGEFFGLAEPLTASDYLIAADGGLTHLKAENLKPNCILGDFDSLGYVPQDSVVFPVEKDDTDSMLAVRQGFKLGFRRFILYGAMEGKRIDHTIANFQTLQFIANQGGVGFMVGKDTIATLIQNGALTLPASDCGIFSVFCMGADATGVTIRGGQYPLEQGVLTAGMPLGVSNHFVGEKVEIFVENGSLLVLSPLENGFPEVEIC